MEATPVTPGGCGEGRSQLSSGARRDSRHSSGMPAGRGTWPLSLQVCLHCQGAPGVNLRHAWLLWPWEPSGGTLGLAVEAISVYRTPSARAPATVLAPGCLRPRLEGQRSGGYSRGPRHRVTLQRGTAVTGASAGHCGTPREAEAPRFSLAPLLAPLGLNAARQWGLGPTVPGDRPAQELSSVRGPGAHRPRCGVAERRPWARPRQGIQQTCRAGSTRTRWAVVQGPLPGPGFPASPLGKHWPKVAPLSSMFFGAETSALGVGGPGCWDRPWMPASPGDTLLRAHSAVFGATVSPFVFSPLPGSPGFPRPDRSRGRVPFDSPERKSAVALRPAWQLTSFL